MTEKQPTLVHLIRHGDVTNPDRILYGRIPGFHLSARGRSQAAATGVSLKDHDIQFLGASPLERTVETAEIIRGKLAAGGNLKVTKMDELLEADSRLEGLRITGWKSQLLNPVRWPMLIDPVTPSWNEPLKKQRDRMLGAIEHARRAAAGHEAVLVSHQLPIVCATRHAQGIRLPHFPWVRYCSHASITTFMFDGPRLVGTMYATPAAGI